MRHVNRSTALFLIVVVVGAAACAPKAEALPPAAVTVEKIEGTDLSRLTLSAHAAERLGIETAEVADVRDAPAGSGATTFVPYSAVLYDIDGGTWVYTNPEPLQFVRQSISVEQIVGDRALLNDGPPVGSLVVTVGVAELHGVEAGVGGGH